MSFRDPPVFRFAPSPNGDLHLGHALSALINHAMARESGGRFLLRFEDIDPERCRPDFEHGIRRDLAWLGIDWDGEPRRQSEHFADYRAALERLRDEGLVYPAFLSRGEIRAAAERSERETGLSYPRDPDGAPLYPGLDRDLPQATRAARITAGEPHVFRLDMTRAVARAGVLGVEETGSGPDGETGRLTVDPAAWGDVVLARKGLPTSYHLAVTLDDAIQGVTHVVRGRDLFAATAVHRLLQALLDLPVPVYHHHALVLGQDGRKLSKSRGDVSIRALREAGASREDLCRRLGLRSAEKGEPEAERGDGEEG
ncbi:glutamyl-Q tRNA(Asp) ligase [Aureimonas sp. Leaf454]|uniref:tRNA glutamyl-Q(34) synthetase GluQRS n=1 Tax=Aureimonas sp. Leaf454 TaxID=1736381 RepID=UPI0006FAA1BC|nr:tRNA glutamyl-Q(34) synthetase GluQRS [Aureimonas sp. Leaf454]KQT44423.1 glutamyl-Q tRNA(Asp) ligase [Aureimonas sp. Leaf454]